MASLAVLSVLVSGFGYACVACAVGAALAYVWGDELSSMLAMAIDYDGLDIEEIATIEEARAELARKARERRSPQPSTAYIGRSRVHRIRERGSHGPLHCGMGRRLARGSCRARSAPYLWRATHTGGHRAQARPSHPGRWGHAHMGRSSPGMRGASGGHPRSQCLTPPILEAREQCAHTASERKCQ